MNDRRNILTGTIASRMCPLCGHHEVGLVTQDGEFYALKKGMEVQIHGPSRADTLQPEEKPAPLRRISPPEDTEEGVPWAPDPVLSKKPLRMKYAVRIKADQAKNMSPEVYRFAYLEKLKQLIEKEICVPLPVILDRFFTAPHLASGNPQQVAEAMWRELKEVREPVRRVEEWLVSGEVSIFAEEPESKDPEISWKHHTGEDIQKELEELSLEDFLALL